jgi:flagellar basal-body rod protein FlgB
MSSLYLFSLASQNNQWLSTRQTLIAGNIANANTPGFKELDLQPFEAVLDSTGLKMAATQPGHMKPEAAAIGGSSTADKGQTWDIYHSGNNVSLEQELLKAGEVNRAYSLNTSIMKSFNRMLLASSKGG